MIRQDLGKRSNVVDILARFSPDAQADKQRDLGLAVVWERGPNVLFVILHLIWGADEKGTLNEDAPSWSLSLRSAITSAIDHQP